MSILIFTCGCTGCDTAGAGVGIGAALLGSGGDAGGPGGPKRNIKVTRVNFCLVQTLSRSTMA